MSKAKLILLLKGFVFFILGIYLSSQGLPSDSTGATIYAGNEIMDAINETSDSPHVESVAVNTKEALSILGIGATIIGLLEMILAFIALIKG